MLICRKRWDVQIFIEKLIERVNTLWKKVKILYAEILRLALLKLASWIVQYSRTNRWWLSRKRNAAPKEALTTRHGSSFGVNWMEQYIVIEKLTAGNPRSNNPKPTNPTTGAMPSGLKNLQNNPYDAVNLLWFRSLNFSLYLLLLAYREKRPQTWL